MTDEYIDNLLKAFVETENSKLFHIIYDDYNLDLSCLDDKSKFSLIVLLHNQHEYGCTKKRIKKIIPNWSDYKIRKLAKETDVQIVALFNDEGLLNGKGYMFSWKHVTKFKHIFFERIKTNNNGISWYYSL